MELSDTLELQEYQRRLECILSNLDRIGAGIAAVHVNAAIEQLRTNLEGLEDSEPMDFDPRLICMTRSSNLSH